MSGTTREARRLAGWCTPRIDSFDFVGLARALGLFGASDCRARRQGRCEGRTLCADCAWSEDATQKR